MARVTRSSTRAKAQPSKDEKKVAVAVAKKPSIKKKKIEKKITKAPVEDGAGAKLESDRIVSIEHCKS